MKETIKIKPKDYSRQRLTNEEYLRRIKNVYGDNITVLEPYVNQRTKILHRCNIHNYEWPARTKQMTNGHNGCKYCSSEKRTKSKTSDIDEVKKKVKEKCGNEFIVNEDNIYVNHNEKIWFTHFPKDGIPHKVYSKPDRIFHNKCAVCAGLQVCVGYNDIWTTNPELGKLLADPEDGYKYTQNSNKRTDFKCPICGNICKNKIINQVNKDMDVRCPICNDGVSYPNKFIYNILLQIENDLDFLYREYKPEWCKFNFRNKERKGYYDIYIGVNNRKYIIEMDGGFHNRTFPECNNLTIDEIIFIDSEKDRLAEENGLKIIRIDCDYNVNDKYEYIKHNILISELKELLDFNKIDFDNANIKSQKSLLIECCQLWDKGLKISEIIEKTYVHECTVSTYLKKGMKYGLCHNYSASESSIRARGESVTCVNTGVTYTTILEPSKIYNVHSKGIKNCCLGNDFSAGKDLVTGEKLFWMYTDEYNKLTKEQINEYLINKKIYEYTNENFGTPVYCITTNKIFMNCMDAAREYNILDGGIRKCCKGEMKTSGQLKDGTRLEWIYFKDYCKLHNITVEEFIRKNSSIFM